MTQRHLMRHALLGAAATTAAAFAFSAPASAAEWNTVKETSAVQFVAVQQGTRFNGRFEEFTAEIDFDPEAPESGSIVGTVQTASVNTRDHDRDATLLDGDWFDAANHPEARFESQSIESLGDGSYQAQGELTLKGETKPMTLNFTFETQNGNAAKFGGQMTINRFDFNVGEGWNDTSWVGEEVDVGIELDLTQ